jgi:hypothetical protein
MKGSPMASFALSCPRNINSSLSLTLQNSSSLNVLGAGTSDDFSGSLPQSGDIV